MSRGQMARIHFQAASSPVLNAALTELLALYNSSRGFKHRGKMRILVQHRV